MAPDDPRDRLLGSLVSAARENAAACGVILFGLPFDGAVLGRRGAAAGPRSLRTAAKRLKTGRLDGSALRARVLDLGDAELAALDVAQAHRQAEALAREALRLARREKAAPPAPPARVVALGGDHSLSYPCALPYLERFGERLAVINLDAHLDVRRPAPGEPCNSGTSFGRLLEKGLQHYTVIGARDFQTSPHYVRRVREAGGRIVAAGEVFAKGAEALAREVLDNLPPSREALYLSVDLDVGDAAIAPAVSAPTPGGLLAHQIFELVRAFAGDARNVACDIMELAPMLAVPGSDRTPRLAAACLAEIIAAAGAGPPEKPHRAGTSK